MAPFVTVFVNDRSADIIHRFTKFHPVLADSVLKSVSQIARKYHQSNCRFFTMIGMYKVEELQVMPDLVIGFDENSILAQEDWEFLFSFVKLIYNGDEISEETIHRLRHILPEVETVTLSQPAPTVNQGNEHYNFSCTKSGNTCYASIEKPFTDRPYTVVIENYTPEIGLVPLFTGLYVSTSWGVCSQDYAFLLKLWDYLGLNEEFGELDLDRRLQEEIEACKNGKPEPILYRASISDVQMMRKRQRSE